MTATFPSTYRLVRQFEIKKQLLKQQIVLCNKCKWQDISKLVYIAQQKI